MVPADHHRSLQFSAPDHVVEGDPEPCTVGQTDPAYPCRKPLELDAFLRHLEPIMEMGILRNQFLHLLIGTVDVFRVPGKRGPAEGAITSAEERTDAGRDEAGEIECVLNPFFKGHLSDVVAVVDGGNALTVKVKHGPHMSCHRILGGLDDGIRLGFPHQFRFFQAPAGRQVAIERVMGRSLVGHGIRADSTFQHFR